MPTPRRRNAIPAPDEGTLTTHRDLLATLGTLGSLVMDLEAFARFVRDGLGLEIGDGADGGLSTNLAARAASDDGQGRSRDNTQGLPFLALQTEHGLGWDPAGTATATAGIYADDHIAVAVSANGMAFGVQLSSTRNSCTFITRMGPVLVLQSDQASTAWRRAAGFDSNTTRTKLPADLLAGHEAPLVALAIVLQRYFMAKPGAKARHATKGWVAAQVSRHLRQELILHLVRRLYPQERVVANARSASVPELEGLELDIWVPHLRLGIEHQGEQHLRPIEHFGGEKAFIQRQANDQRKKELCAAHGITLVEFSHDESLDEELLTARIHAALARSS